MDETMAEERKAPYVAFATLKNFLATLSTKPLPPQIDRSIMLGKSGTDQTYLFGALKFFGFIDGALNVTEALKIWATADDDERKVALAKMIRELYGNQIKISNENGTQQKLLDSFESDFGYNGATKRKAMTFFLQGATWAGVALSPHFKVNKVGNNRTTVPRGKRTTRKKQTIKPPSMIGGSGHTQGEHLAVTFGEAGTVDIFVNISWLKLDDTTFTDLRTELNKIQALGVKIVPSEESDDDDENLDEIDEVRS